MVVLLLIVGITVGVFFGISVAKASGYPVFGVAAGIIGIIACFYLNILAVIIMIAITAFLMLKSKKSY